MQGSSSRHGRTGRVRRAPDHGLTVVSFEVALVFVFAIVLVIVVHKKRSSGRFVATCGNPQHRLWRSSDSSPLRHISPAVLRHAQGNHWRLNRRQKFCEDCIAKLINKPAYRHLFTEV